MIAGYGTWVSPCSGGPPNAKANDWTMKNVRTQYVGSKDLGTQYRGARRLLSAIILAAFDEIEGVLVDGGLSGSKMRWRASDESYQWVQSNQRDGLFDYLEICELLGLNPAAGRQHANALNDRIWNLISGRNAPDQGQRHDRN